jgi:hypothetical protein
MPSYALLLFLQTNSEAAEAGQRWGFIFGRYVCPAVVVLGIVWVVLKIVRR